MPTQKINQEEEINFKELSHKTGIPEKELRRADDLMGHEVSGTETKRKVPEWDYKKVEAFLASVQKRSNDRPEFHERAFLLH